MLYGNELEENLGFNLHLYIGSLLHRLNLDFMCTVCPFWEWLHTYISTWTVSINVKDLCNLIVWQFKNIFGVFWLVLLQILYILPFSSSDTLFNELQNWFSLVFYKIHNTKNIRPDMVFNLWTGGWLKHVESRDAQIRVSLHW